MVYSLALNLTRWSTQIFSFSFFHPSFATSSSKVVFIVFLLQVLRSRKCWRWVVLDKKWTQMRRFICVNFPTLNVAKNVPFSLFITVSRWPIYGVTIVHDTHFNNNKRKVFCLKIYKLANKAIRSKWFWSGLHYNEQILFVLPLSIDLRRWLIFGLSIVHV